MQISEPVARICLPSGVYYWMYRRIDDGVAYVAISPAERVGITTAAREFIMGLSAGELSKFVSGDLGFFVCHSDYQPEGHKICLLSEVGLDALKSQSAQSRPN